MTNEVASYEGAVIAALPLALLAATRSHDRQSEVLEDEDLLASLPRRLGLSGVIETQIYRYQTAAKSGKRVSNDEFINLLKLVLRRPDAEPILRETGARVAQHQFESVPPAWVKMLRLLPRAAINSAIRRAATKLLRNISGVDAVTVEGNPITASVTRPAAATLEPAGVACSLYGSALEEIASQYLGKKPGVVHASCVSNGARVCEWSLRS